MPHFRAMMLHSRPLRRVPIRVPNSDECIDNVLVAYQHREHADLACADLQNEYDVQVKEYPIDELRYTSWLLRTPVVVLMTSRCDLNDKCEEHDLMYIGNASWDNVDPLVLPYRSGRGPRR